MQPGQDLVFVTVDCLRADRVTAETAPFVSALGQRAERYTEAYANGCGTPDSFPALFASRLAQPFADRDQFDVDDEYALTASDVTLAEALHDAGYHTAGFVAGNPYLGRRYGYHRGFDVFADFQPSTLLDRVTGTRLRGALRGMASRLSWSPYPDGAQITDAAIAFLAARGTSRDRERPLFLWLHYMDAHFPTLPRGALPRGPRGFAARRAAWSPIRGEPARHHDLLVELYDLALGQIDAQLARLQPSLPPEATYVVTSDHGQLFGEHDSYWHNGVWEQLIRVPLIVGGPRVASGALRSEPVQLLDLSPHLLRSLDVEPPRAWAGRELRAPQASIYAVSNDPAAGRAAEAWISGEEKKLRTSDGTRTYPRHAESLSLTTGDLSAAHVADGEGSRQAA